VLGAQDHGPAGGAVLPREFFARPALAVADRLLGCVLEHETGEGLVAVVLTEVEAYEGSADPASHAYRGRTARNGVMFGAPGHAYVYFTYGMHFCVNLVCQPEGIASALLLRAGRVVDGVPLAAARRSAGRDGAGRGPLRPAAAVSPGAVRPSGSAAAWTARTCATRPRRCGSGPPSRASQARQVRTSAAVPGSGSAPPRSARGGSG
jgi:DNA-3-methyladenine glycosylase